MGAGEVEIASKWSGELPATGEYRIDISTIESEFAGYELNLSLSEPPASADEIELSQEYLDCMSKSGAVRVSVLNCIAAETQHHDARLNRLYKELMRQFSDEQKKQLKGVQRLWIKYRDANCYLYATPHETGVYGAEDCFMQATAARAKELEAFLGP
ncbi:MAG: DUF1311 domain-containing protein [Gammaproteobacteria bacterium]|nr:DUF1311 domain-containing protein [Gammaproteobacteria bacterium]